jgi:group I intron endonuclease
MGPAYKRNNMIITFPNTLLKSGIYRIINTINGKSYIGSSSNLPKRKIGHFCNLRCNKHNNKHLQSAWNKYGEPAFVFEVLLTCHSDLLIWYEQQFINALMPEYNIYTTIGNQPRGYSLSEETKRKLSMAKKGKPAHPNTVAALYLRKGKKFTEEHRQNLSKAHSGRGGIIPTILGPDGIKYNDINNIRQFCREHNLYPAGLNAVIKGKYTQHHGYRLCQ